MKTWYDKKGRECYGYARGGIKAALESDTGMFSNNKFWYYAIEDMGGLSVYRQNNKRKAKCVYYRAFGD